MDVDLRGVILIMVAVVWMVREVRGEGETRFGRCGACGNVFAFLPLWV